MSEESNSRADVVEASSRRYPLALPEIVGGLLVLAVAVFSLFISEVGVFVAPLVLLGGALILLGFRAHRMLVTGVGALLLLSPLFAYGLSLWLLFSAVTRHSRIPQARWPYTLSVVASDTAAAPQRVVAVSMGGFIDSSSAWRIPVEPGTLVAAVRDLAASEIPASRVPAAFWDSFPREIQPPRLRSNRYFISEGFPVDERGEDGDHHMAMYDSEARQLYVWEIRNF